jgi:hypothetical protein
MQSTNKIGIKPFEKSLHPDYYCTDHIKRIALPFVQILLMFFYQLLLNI